jgi:hypothetical protein
MDETFLSCEAKSSNQEKKSGCERESQSNVIQWNEMK